MKEERERETSFAIAGRAVDVGDGIITGACSGVWVGRRDVLIKGWRSGVGGLLVFCFWFYIIF